MLVLFFARQHVPSIPIHNLQENHKKLEKQGTFLPHLLLITVLPLLFTNTKWKTKSINRRGTFLLVRSSFFCCKLQKFRKRKKKERKNKEQKKRFFLLISVLLNIFFCNCKQKRNEGRKTRRKKTNKMKTNNIRKKEEKKEKHMKKKKERKNYKTWERK